MKFVKFVENRYQELTYDSESSNAFVVRIDAEMKALQGLLSGFRTIVKWFIMPVCLVRYLLVCMYVLPEPEPVMLNKMKKQKEDEDRNKRIAQEMLNDGNVTSINSEKSDQKN